MKYPKLLAYAQLLRAPNVFTAFADICVAGCATGLIVNRPGVFALVLLASGCLYTAGMALNDFFDRVEDAQARAFRPIPSGRVGATTALVIGLLLLASGCGLAAVASLITEPLKPSATPLLVAFALAAAVLGYDGLVKRMPVAPLGMGLCRFLNVLLGVTAAAPGSISDELALHLAGVVGVYIVGVTWFARTEEGTSSRRQLGLAAVVMLAAAVGALAVPVHPHPRDPQWVTPFYFPYLVAGFLFYVGVPAARAIRRPEPKLVQAAVKRSIFGLVALDAVLAVAFVGWPGLLILLLLLPATWLGKWVYST